MSDLIYCTNIVDKKSKSCRKKYCEHCLRKFYKEEPLEIPDRKQFVSLNFSAYVSVDGLVLHVESFVAVQLVVVVSKRKNLEGVHQAFPHK